MVATTASTRVNQAHSVDLRLVHVREGQVRLDVAGSTAAEKLRAEEYIDRRSWIDPSQRNAVGGETDQFDDTASHYAVLRCDPESSSSGVTAVGAVRLVHSDRGDLPLFEAFPALRTPSANHLEISRYISRSMPAASALRAVIVAELLQTGMTGVALISVGLRKLLARQGFVLREIAGPQIVEQYGRWPQVAVAIDAEASAAGETLAILMPAALERDWATVISLACEVKR